MLTFTSPNLGALKCWCGLRFVELKNIIILSGILCMLIVCPSSLLTGWSPAWTHCQLLKAIAGVASCIHACILFSWTNSALRHIYLFIYICGPYYVLTTHNRTPMLYLTGSICSTSFVVKNGHQKDMCYVKIDHVCAWNFHNHSKYSREHHNWSEDLCDHVINKMEPLSLWSL